MSRSTWAGPAPVSILDARRGRTRVLEWRLERFGRRPGTGGFPDATVSRRT
ncbi:hypothetical protein ACFPK5_15515 [Streptomyces beijiangensis]|uniref:hypothetical protein n=1 Tax=Streptomyces beijiangensis TaxID=163361 RepID=UPI003616FFF2